MSPTPAAVDGPLSILRIKRKRGQQSLPLDALRQSPSARSVRAVIQPPEPSSKRRRNGEVGPSSTAGPSRGLFRFVETVSAGSFDTANQTRQITDRISSFAKLPPVAPALRRVSSNQAIRSALNSPGSPSRKLPSQVRAARAAVTTGAGASAGSSGSSGSREEAEAGQKRSGNALEVQQDAKRARYRIVEKSKGAFAQEPVDTYKGPRPPQVLTASEMNRPPAPRIYDAIEEEQFDQPTKANILRSRSDEDDALMSSFVPMLQEYLSLQDPLASPDRSRGGAPPVSIEPSSPPEDEFVYDLYYRSEHPVSTPTTDFNLLGPSSTFDDVGSLAGLQRIGELAGLDEDEILNDELSSEEEDEADQDSNDEGDYRNDYPEGEDDYDSDEVDDDDDRPSWSD